MIATASALGALALVRAMQPALEAPLAEQAGNAAAPVDMAAATALPAMPETAGETAAKPALRVAGLRLRIDETISSTPVSDAVNEVDARLHSLIERHDRLVEMAADLNESASPSP